MRSTSSITLLSDSSGDCISEKAWVQSEFTVYIPGVFYLLLYVYICNKCHIIIMSLLNVIGLSQRFQPFAFAFVLTNLNFVR